MRILYFDISGTLTREGSERAKPQLNDGAFGEAVRAAGFERLVCVSSLVRVVPGGWRNCLRTCRWEIDPGRH